MINGAVVNLGNDDLMAIVALLSQRTSNEVNYIYYPTHHDIDPRRHHDFIIVGSREAIMGTVRRYRRARQPVPHLVHVIYGNAAEADTVDTISELPGVSISTLCQASLDNPRETLQISLFEDIIAAIQANVG